MTPAKYAIDKSCTPFISDIQGSQGHRVLTMIQTYQKTLAPLEMGPLPVCAGHSERKPVRTYEGKSGATSAVSPSTAESRRTTKEAQGSERKQEMGTGGQRAAADGRGP